MRSLQKTIGVTLLVALLSAACGSPEVDPVDETSSPAPQSTQTQETTPTTTSTTSAQTTQPPATSTTAAPGGSGDDERTIEIVMTDFAFDPEQLEVSAGETVRFVVFNEGAVDHEFRLSNSHRIEEHMASGHGDHDEEGGHHSEEGDVYIELEPGEQGELTFTFPEDTTLYTETACLLPGHYEAGMKGTISYTNG